MKTLLLVMALAQTRPGTRTTVAPVTTVTFDPYEITGTSGGPSGIVIEGQPRVLFPGLIRVRQNFNREILQSVNDVK